VAWYGAQARAAWQEARGCISQVPRSEHVRYRGGSVVGVEDRSDKVAKKESGVEYMVDKVEKKEVGVE
jgi:hypothetical protein